MNKFKDWQKVFYNSKQWISLRNSIRSRDEYTCQICKELILKKKWIVDHIEEITPENKNNPQIILNPDNLQLLCITCHNKKTFRNNKKPITKIDFTKRDKF